MVKKGTAAPLLLEPANISDREELVLNFGGGSENNQ